jgi:hypothetical protein
MPHTFSRDPAIDESEPDVFAQARSLRYRHTAEEIAVALVLVGKGATYRQAAISSSAGLSDNAQRVVKWVERFAPAVTSPDAGRSWPAVVAVGSLAHGRGDHDAVVQLVVSTAADQVSPCLWKCRSDTDRGDGRVWRNLFTAHGGRPQVLIVQRGSKAAVAALRTWPDRPPLLIDPRSWHRVQPAERYQAHPLSDAGRRFIDNGHVADVVRYLGEARRTVREKISRRHAHFKDLGRLNLVLALMRAEINGDADLVAYAERIADFCARTHYWS